MPPPTRARAVVWKPLVVCPQPDFHRRMLAVLAELGIDQPSTLTEYPAAGAIAALAQRNACNICFLDAATDSARAELLITELAPAVPVVVLHPRNDADLILRCLRGGACEFVAEPSPESLRGVFERLARTRSDAAHPAAGAVYCVVPGKPGSGASTLAAHLAIQLRANGVKPVLLVDGDHMTASLTFQLKLKPEFHLEDVLRDWSRMDDDLWSRLTVPAYGVDVLAAPEDPTTRISVSRQAAGELIAFWRERYAVVILDLPDVRTAVDCGFAALADLVLLVTTNRLAALQATVRGLRYLDSGAGDRARLRLILNRHSPVTGLKREDVKAALSLQPFAILSADYEVIQSALLEGRPAPAGSRFGAGVQALCRELTRKHAPERRNSSWLSSLLHRKQVVSQ